MTLYMAVTADKYELPIAVETTLEDIAEVFGISTNAVSSSIAKNRSGKHKGVKFIRVKVYG